MMAMKFWAGACFMSCFCFLGSAAAQEPAATRCPPATSVAVGQHAPATSADRAHQQGCSETRSDDADADKALGVALLGCAIAFASHIARRRSAKVVLS
jgi:hypothetical protein